MSWIDVALMAVLGLALWAWLTLRLLEWFEREVWASSGPDQPVRTEVPVRGMACGACERRVSAALARLDGVREAEADHRTARVVVRYDAERVDERALREEIDRCGFRPL